MPNLSPFEGGYLTDIVHVFYCKMSYLTVCPNDNNCFVIPYQLEKKLLIKAVIGTSHNVNNTNAHTI